MTAEDKLQDYQKDYPEWDAQAPHEEALNSVLHGIGALLSIAALVVLVYMAAKRGDVWRIVSFSIYGASLVLLYTASTLHHALHAKRIKRFFEVMDHISIFFLIAGTYTPITMVLIRGAWGWTLFGLIWGLALLGVVLKIFFLGKLPWLELALYIGMGWLVVIAIKPMLELAPHGLLWGLLVGGLFYTFGVAFYIWKRLPYHHAVWHLFVLAGSAVHFAVVLRYLA